MSIELPTFSQFVSCFVGDDKETFFWEDRWVGEGPLLSSFLVQKLYYLGAFGEI